MTSAEDFHLISWRNFLGLSAVVAGVLIPVGLRYYFKRELASVNDIEAIADAEPGQAEVEDRIFSHRPRVDIGNTKTARLILLNDDDDVVEGGEVGFDSEGFDYEDDEDIILEAGPAIVIKPKDYLS